jgi:hypothetical protein
LKKGQFKSSNFDSKPIGCHECGKNIHPSEAYWNDRGLEGRFALCSSSCKEKFVDSHKSGKRNNGKVDSLIQENHELRQQLTTVQNQLAQVLEELKKLKNNSVGQDTEKLTQQIVQNEKLIKSGAKVSEAEIREQVQKSEALLKGANVSVAPTQDNKNSNDSLPYLIGGSVILALVGIIGYCLVKKNRGKKVV